MDNWITELEINNFKSIRNMKMECKRINVLIGRPNVGKSNILEALCLYLAPYCDNTKKVLADYIRYEKLSQLFYNEDRKKEVIVKSNLGVAQLRQFSGNANIYDNINEYYILIADDIEVMNDMNIALTQSYHNNDAEGLFNEISSNRGLNKTKELQAFFSRVFADEKLANSSGIKGYNYSSPIKKYEFKALTEHKNPFPLFLNPPFGDNLYTILENNKDLYKECNSFFRSYGLDLLINPSYEKLEVQKIIDGRIYPIPYFLSADTLQRYIFHIAAIETNTNSILLFEKPESHSFPPYISRLAETIIENETNQFFITTHSPYLLTPFIEQCTSEDVAIFIADYENYETKIRALTEEEIQNILDTGIDLFYNISAFQNDRNRKNLS